MRLRAVLFCITVCLASLCIALPARAYVTQTQRFAAPSPLASAPPQNFSFASKGWQHALRASGFFDFTSQRPARFPTVAYFTYDAKNLYVGFQCGQAGAPIIAAQTVNHANVYSDDHVTFAVDTSGTGSRIYEFAVNPKGVHSETSSENARYAPVWFSSAKELPGGGYDVVMVIPLSDIRAQSAAVQNWRINFERYIASTNDEYTWAFDPAEQNYDDPQFWPVLAGVRITAHAARPRPRLNVYGLGSAGSDRDQFQNGVGNFTSMRPRALGADFTYPLTNTLSFVGTINPDFSNVEQDQTIISPQEFARNYSEYRPFFSQGAQYINSLPGININNYDTLFYTPSIGVFNSGEKVEGTIGRSTIGTLNVSGLGFDDTATGYQYTTPDNETNLSFESVDANHVGLHDQADGVAMTDQNSHSGVVAGARLQWERGTLVTAPSQAQDDAVLTGLKNAHWEVFGVYYDIGPQYNPVDGYVTLNDVRGPQGFVQYTGQGGTRGSLKSYQVVLLGDRYADRSGATHQADVIGNATVTFKSLLSVSYGTDSSELRTYAQPYPVYSGAQNLLFNARSLGLGYRDGTPAPIDFSYSWGPYGIGQGSATGNMFLRQFDLSTSRQYGTYGISAEYQGNVEQPYPGSALLPKSQWLRRISLSRSFGRDTTIALALRSISGTGGFALPGTNIALSYHQRFRNQDQLYIDYGTPAAASTLHRLIVKFVFHSGGGSGT